VKTLYYESDGLRKNYGGTDAMPLMSVAHLLVNIINKISVEDAARMFNFIVYVLHCNAPESQYHDMPKSLEKYILLFLRSAMLLLNKALDQVDQQKLDEFKKRFREMPVNDSEYYKKRTPNAFALINGENNQ
jgi:hypothetical protein